MMSNIPHTLLTPPLVTVRNHFWQLMHENSVIQKVADFCFKILREKQKQQRGQILLNLFEYHNMAVW